MSEKASPEADCLTLNTLKLSGNFSSFAFKFCGMMLKDMTTLLSSMLSGTEKMYCASLRRPSARERAVTGAQLSSHNSQMGPCWFRKLWWVVLDTLDLETKVQSQVPQLVLTAQASLFCEPLSLPLKKKKGKNIPHLVKMFLKL